MTRRKSHFWQSSWVPGCQNNAPVLRVVPDLVNDLHSSRKYQELHDEGVVGERKGGGWEQQGRFTSGLKSSFRSEQS